MRAVTFVAKDTVEVLEKSVPEIGPNEVLLRVGGAGICHSDIILISKGGDNPLLGGTLGHEVAGTVEQLGANVQGWAVGDRAIVALILSCGYCRECLAGRDNLCETVYARSSLTPLTPGIGTPGGMADFMAVKAQHLLPIGNLDPVEAAPLADAALTPLHAINSVRDRMTGDATVVAIGLGGLGHIALQILAATTGARIIALDTDPEKLAFAQQHGADLALPSDAAAAARILEETNGIGADVVLDFVGVQPTVDLACAVVRGGGAIRFVGLGGGRFQYVSAAGALPWSVNIERAYGGTRAEMLEVIGLAQAGKIRAEVTRYSLDDAAKAFEDLHHGRVSGRAVLVP